MTKKTGLNRRELMAGAALAATAATAACAAAQTGTSEAKSLAGKSVLITGCSSGFGRLGAELYARLGAKVFATMRNLPRAEATELAALAEADGLDIEIIELDVTSDESVAAAVATALASAGGKIDVLVNNAATTNFIDERDLDAMTEDKWDRIFAVNVKGSFFCSRAAVALLRENGGAIVNVSSVAGISGNGSSIAYSASKGAINTLTKTLARTLAPAIRVNAVLPGPVDSRWLRESMTDEEIQELAADWPLPRPVHPNDVADTVFYLATQTQHTTGQLLVLDGGRTM